MMSTPALSQPRASQVQLPTWAARAGLRLEQAMATSARGYPVRVVITKPARATRQRLAALIFIPWLSCDPVEVPGSTDDGYIRFVRDLSIASGMIVARVEKPGVAGSDGPDCSRSTLDDDLDAFRAGIASMRSRPDVDTTRIVLVGGSIGGALAAVLAVERPGQIAGVVSVNSFARTWYEHMIGLERRRLSFADSTPDRLGVAMRQFELLYTGFLIDRQTPGDVLASHPELRAIWYDTTTGQYGRSATYFQQLQALDVDRALAALDVPALFISSGYDWVMGRDEASIAATRVNRFHTGRATTRVYARVSHGPHVYASADDAFHGRNGQYEPTVARDVVAWLRGLVAVASR
jgi:pimeloyl-ACP methyl ester carboxylesterase